MPTLADYPRLAAEFDLKRNAPHVPAKIKSRSSRLFWWRCPVARDHQWRATAGNRAAGTGCPFCAGRRVSITNSLAARAPAVAKQFDKTRNGSVDPRQIVMGSNRRVWWRCPRGPDHVWRSMVRYRAIEGAGCPFCAGQYVSVTNCLATRNPRLACEWDTTQNGKLTPREVTSGSYRKVWWRCRKDRRHCWQSTVCDRSAGHGCPFCKNRKASPGRSLADLLPAIAALWHPKRNAPLAPRDVVPGTTRRVWWKCSRGPDHEWESTVRARAKSAGCPFCSNARVSITNCLATLFPKVARTWHPTKNASITPRDVLARSRARYWWMCAAGHAWRAIVSNRTTHGSGCPICYGQRRGRVVTKRKRARKVWLPSDWR